MNRAVVQTAGAMQTDKPNFTDWTANPSFRFNDDEEGDDDTLDRL